VVVCVQFYLVRLAGVSFERTAILLVVLNLPVVFLICKRPFHFSSPDRKTCVLILTILLVSVACLTQQLLDGERRMYYGHPWMHASIAYRVAAGELVLQDPELAGVRLFYPWGGHVYQAVLSYLLGSPPLYDYIWTNLVLLICVYVLAAAMVVELGGNYLARITSGLWLFFGVNFVGYLTRRILPSSLMQSHAGFTGDYRFTPWVLKFIDFQQMPMALAMFMALVYLTVHHWRQSSGRYHLVLAGVLLCGIGVIYPILFPVAFALVAAHAGAILLLERRTPHKIARRQMGTLLATLLVPALLATAHLKFITHERMTSELVLSGWRSLLSKAVACALATSPLLVGLYFAFRKCWETQRGATIVLLSGAIVSLLLNMVVTLPYWNNEYKFMFPAAICLAPFPALALEAFRERLGRLALPVLVLSACLLASPLALKMYEDWPHTAPDRPSVDVRGFFLRLRGGEALAGLCDAVRERTSVSSILVSESEAVHFPTLTARALYVPPQGERVFPGVNLSNDTLLTKIRGYHSEILTERRLDLKGLFQGQTPGERTGSLSRMLAFNRPLAIVLDRGKNQALLDWLISEKKGRLLYRADNWILWLIEPGNYTAAAKRPFD